MGYIFNQNTQTPEDVARTRAIADLLMNRAQQDVTSAPGVIGTALGGLGGILANRRANAAESAGRDKAGALWQSILGGSSSPAPQSTSMQPAAAGDMTRARQSISAIESGGKYDALGPVTKRGDRAYGKYQVMGANIPEWTQAALGQRLTPQQFLSSPEAQDKVFDHRFGGYMKEHGPENAASMWFTGRPLAQGANAADQLGTTGRQYADRFMRGMGGGVMDKFNALKQAGIGRSSIQQAGMREPQNNLLQAMGDQSFGFLSPEQQQYAVQLLQQQMQSADPTYQLNLKKAQLELQMKRKELDSYGQPKPYEPTDDMREYDLSKKDPAFAKYLADQKRAGATNVNVGDAASIEQRKVNAASLGIKPDDPSYNSYVLTGKLPREDQSPLTSTDKQAILAADEMVAANQQAIDILDGVLAGGDTSLNNRAGEGSLAPMQAWMARNDPTGLFDDSKGEATTELDNKIIGQALANLKSIFGGNPTEGERKILLDMQGSTTKTAKERELIYRNARDAAKRRLDFNKSRADELRGQTYYKPNSAGKQQSAPQSTVIDGYTIEEVQ